jgi:hypothetical protein
MVNPGDARAFTGVYEFTGPSIAPDTRHEVVVRADDREARLAMGTLPAAVPAGLDRAFNVLLVSCFHQTEDREGLAGNLVAGLPVQLRPHMSILMGDQVYLDLPTLANFKAQRTWLARKFEEDYTANWRGPHGYARLLDAAPSISTPDDHEYWNDFPSAMPHIETTWKREGRTEWRVAARNLYAAFQANPLAGKPAFELDVDPLSILVLDTRSDRTPDNLMSPAMLAQFQTWIDRLIAQRKFGVVATGQSFLDKPAGKLALDKMLSNFGDYRPVVEGMKRAFDAGVPLVLLTGDVHYGRVTEIRDATRMRTAAFEVISSPSSLVSSIGIDQIKTIGAAIGGIFGRKNPWPRHGDPKDPEEFFAKHILQSRYPISRVHRQKGNMVALLSFRRHGEGLELTVRYWPIHRKPAAPVPDVVSRPLILTTA